SRRRHTRFSRDWSSDVCSSDLPQSREFRTGPAFAGVHRERQIGVAKQLFAAMGIAREDAERRQDWVLRGFRQFDAPVCIIVTYRSEERRVGTEGRSRWWRAVGI